MTAVSHLTSELVAACIFLKCNKKAAASSSVKHVRRQFFRRMMYFRL